MTSQKVTRGVGSAVTSLRPRWKRGITLSPRHSNAVAVTAEMDEHEWFLPLTMDFTDPSAVDDAVRKALDHFDVLISNAGRFHTGFFETLSAEQVRAHQISFNFNGAFCRKSLPLFEGVDDLVFSI